MRNKLTLAGLALLLAIPVIAYAADTILQSDKVQFGRGAVNVDKILEFNIGVSPNNPQLNVDRSLQDFSILNATQANIKTDLVQVGDGNASGNQQIVFDKGLGAANPRMRFNQSTAKIEFANDGTTFKSMGSGSGSGSGINMLVDFNSDFEAGVTNWTNVGGVFTEELADVGNGVKSGEWDASANLQTLSSTAVTPQNQLKGKACTGSVQYKGAFTAGDYTLQVLEGATVVATSVLVPRTQYGPSVNLPFTCATAATHTLRVLANADALPIFIDDAFLGQSPFAQVTQPIFVASGYIAGAVTCAWTTTSATPAAFGTTAACLGPTVELNPGPGVLQTTDTNLPRFTMNNLPEGTYRVTIAGGSSTTSSAQGNSIGTAISDGTSVKAHTISINSAGSFPYFSHTMIGTFVYSSMATRTFEVFGFTSAGTMNMENASASARLYFTIERMPTSEETVAFFGQLANSWSGSHGTDCSFPRTNAAYGDPTADVSCTFSQRQNTNFGTVTSYLSGSDKLPGIVYTPSSAALYEVCAKFLNEQSGSNMTSFRLYDVTNSFEIDTTAIEHAASNATSPGELCGQRRLPSLAPVTLAIQSAVGAGTVTIQNGSSLANAVEWRIRKIDTSEPAPVVVGLKIADWVSFTPVLSDNTGISLNSAMYRRVGDSYEVSGWITWSATSALTVPFTVGLPAGGTIDTAKLPSVVVGSALVGGGTWNDSGSGARDNHPAYHSSSAVRFLVGNGLGNLSDFAGGNSAGDQFGYSYTVPISGLSSTGP